MLIPREFTRFLLNFRNISGLKHIQYEKKGFDYRCIMPCNLYGKGDNYDGQNSHVIPALMHRAYLAKINGEKQLNVWGTGKPKRELMFVEDFADALVYFMNKKIKYSEDHCILLII